MTNKNPKALSSADPQPKRSTITRYSPQVRKRDRRKATIHCNVWKIGCWTYHQEEKVKFKNLDQSRDWAKKHGYDGIHVELE